MEIRPQDLDGINWRFFVPLLILSVSPIVRCARREEQDVHARRVGEPVCYRYTPAFARQVGRLAEDLGDRSTSCYLCANQPVSWRRQFDLCTGCYIIGMVCPRHPRRPAVDHFDLEGVFGTERCPLLGQVRRHELLSSR
mgnify:CR=1 FL=1